MEYTRFRSELRRFWDEIARGELARPGDLNPELAETIRWLHALDDVPPPDPIYATRLREGLMNAITLSLPRVGPLAGPSRNGDPSRSCAEPGCHRCHGPSDRGR
jgi:hypothetical protein